MKEQGRGEELRRETQRWRDSQSMGRERVCVCGGGGGGRGGEKESH